MCSTVHHPHAMVCSLRYILSLSGAFVSVLSPPTRVLQFFVGWVSAVHCRDTGGGEVQSAMLNSNIEARTRNTVFSYKLSIRYRFSIFGIRDFVPSVPCRPTDLHYYVSYLYYVYGTHTVQYIDIVYMIILDTAYFTCFKNLQYILYCILCTGR